MVSRTKERCASRNFNGMECREMDKWLATKFHHGICNVGVFWEGEGLARRDDRTNGPYRKGVIARVGNVSNNLINSKKHYSPPLLYLLHLGSSHRG